MSQQKQLQKDSTGGPKIPERRLNGIDMTLCFLKSSKLESQRQNHCAVDQLRNITANILIGDTDTRVSTFHIGQVRSSKFIEKFKTILK